MRFAYIDPHPVPGISPPQIQILYTVDGLARAGVEVVLITPRPLRQADPSHILGRGIHPKVTTHYLPNFRKRWWLPVGSSRFFYRMATRMVAGLGVDAVLTRNLKMADRLLGQAACPPLFFETHELFAQSFRENHDLSRGRNQKKLAALIAREARVYAGARGIFALTSTLEQDLRDEYDFLTPTTVLPDGVDIAQVDAAAGPQEPLDERRVLYLGSLHPWKGVAVLIQAISLVPDSRLQIVGGTRERIDTLRRLADNLGVTARVDLVGPVAPHRRFEYIKAAAVCALPLTRASIASRYTSPLKLFEYMAARRAIVASDLPSTREVLDAGVHGVMVPPEDPEALAIAIEQLLHDRALRDRLGAAARRRVEDYDWRQRAARIVEFAARSAPPRPGAGT